MADTSLFVAIIGMSLFLLVLLGAFVGQQVRMSRATSPVDRTAPPPVSDSPPQAALLVGGSSGRRWRFFEYDLTQLSQDLASPTWAAAIARTFDARALAAIMPRPNTLEQILAAIINWRRRRQSPGQLPENSPEAIHDRLQAQSFVEVTPDNQHCVHAPTRVEMLKHLWSIRPDVYRKYAARAAKYYSGLIYGRGRLRQALGAGLYRYVLPLSNQRRLQIEWLYHLAIDQPAAAHRALRFLATTWWAESRFEDVDHLVTALREHVDANRVSGQLAASVLYFHAKVRRRANLPARALKDLQAAYQAGGREPVLLKETLSDMAEVVELLRPGQAAARHEPSVEAAYRTWTDRIGRARWQWRGWADLPHLHQHPEALKHHQETLSIYLRDHNLRGVAHTMSLMGDEYLRLNQPTEALDWYQRALRVYGQDKNGGNGFDEANMLVAQGDAYQLLDRYEEAREAYLKAQAEYDISKTPLSVALALKAEGDVQLLLNNSTDALQRYDAAMSLYRKNGAPLNEAGVLLATGKALQAAGRTMAAQRRFTQVRLIYAQHDDDQGEANASLAGGDVLHAIGRIEEAKDSYAHALKIYQRCRDRLGEANTRLSLARLASAQQDGPEALHQITAAVDLYRAAGASLGEANALVALGQEYQRTQELDLAHKHFEAARLNYAAFGHLRGEAKMQLALGRLSVAQGNVAAGVKHFDLARAAYEGQKHLPGWAEALHALGELSLAGDNADAESQLKSALDIFTEVKDHARQIAVLMLLAEVHIGHAQRAAAVARYTGAIELLIQLPPAQRESPGLHGLRDLADAQFRSAHSHFEIMLGHDTRARWQFSFGLAQLALGQTNAAPATLRAAWDRADLYERASARRWLNYVQRLRPDIAPLLDELELKG